MTQEAINTEGKAILHLANLNLELARTNRRLVEQLMKLSEKAMQLRGQRGWLIRQRQCRHLDKKVNVLEERVSTILAGAQ